MIVTVAAAKGGTGKSTLAVSLAAEWHRRGLRVALVDADPQRSAVVWSDIAAEQGHAAPTVLAMSKGLTRPEQIPALGDRFDVVLVDCPPRNGQVMVEALACADLALIPMGDSPAEVWTLSEMRDALDTVEALRPGLVVRVVLTRAQRTALGAAVREMLAAEDFQTFGSELGLRVAFREAMATGQGVTVYAPSSKAAEEVRALVDEIEGLTGMRRAGARRGEGGTHGG